NNFSLKLVGQITDGFYFPDDEFKALQSGVPLADLFVRLSKHNNQTFLIAHSLGNMIVNSALARPEVSPGMVSKYIMNEAAVPAEAFASNFDQGAEYAGSVAATQNYVVPFLRPYQVPFLASHLAQMGFSTDSAVQDQIWADQLNRVTKCTQLLCLPLNDY